MAAEDYKCFLFALQKIDSPIIQSWAEILIEGSYVQGKTLVEVLGIPDKEYWKTQRGKALAKLCTHVNGRDYDEKAEIIGRLIRDYGKDEWPSDRKILQPHNKDPMTRCLFEIAEARARGGYGSVVCGRGLRNIVKQYKEDIPDQD